MVLDERCDLYRQWRLDRHTADEWDPQRDRGCSRRIQLFVVVYRTGRRRQQQRGVDGKLCDLNNDADRGALRRTRCAESRAERTA